MFRHILVPLDGSQLAEEALSYAALLGRSYECRVTLLQVIEPVDTDLPPSAGAFLLQAADSARQAAQEYLQRQAEALSITGAKVDTRVMLGPVAASINDFAIEEDVDLITMATHGRSGLGRWLVGSIADKVLHLAECPMLVIRPKALGQTGEVHLNSILALLDGSPPAEEVLPYVTDIAQRLGVSVMLVQVVPTAAMLYLGTEYTAVPIDVDSMLEQTATEYLRSVATRLEGDAVRCETVVLKGDPASMISDYAKTAPNSLLALTAHGRSGLARTMLGSVTDRLIRDSGHPIFVLPPTD